MSLCYKLLLNVNAIDVSQVFLSPILTEQRSIRRCLYPLIFLRNQFLKIDKRIVFVSVFRN
jgi:hypothetical protein